MKNKKHGMMGKCPHCDGELVEEGHDFDEVLCEHGSSWIWVGYWTGHYDKNCGCDKPPNPHSSEGSK